MRRWKNAYLSGPEFGQRVKAIANAFGSMKNDLDQEKRAMSNIMGQERNKSSG